MVCLIVLLAVISAGCLAVADQRFVILHSNDARGRFTDTSPKTGGYCSASLMKSHQCIGGLSRTIGLTNTFRKESANGTNFKVLYFFSGGIFSGSIFYRIHKEKICAYFMNALGPDAVNLGLTEFRDEAHTLLGYLKLLNSSVVCSNVDTSKFNDPNFAKILKYKVINVGKIYIGVIGFVNTDLDKSLTKLSIRLEGRKVISHLSEKLHREGANYIILMSSDAYSSEKQFAREVPYLDLVIGGGHDALLWNSELDPPPENFDVADTYPMRIQSNAPGRKERLIVRVLASAQYLGVLNLTLDDTGAVTSYGGQPVYLSNDIKGDPSVEVALKSFGKPVHAYANTSFTKAMVLLEGGKEPCYMRECNLGNMVADAYLYHSMSQEDAFPMWSYYAMALIGAGTIVQSMDPRTDYNVITRVQLLESLPYDSRVCNAWLTGEQLYQALDRATRSTTEMEHFPQVSGLRIVIDRSKPDGQQLLSVRVQTSNCLVPRYEKLNLSKTYNIVSNSWMMKKNPVLLKFAYKRKYCHPGSDRDAIENFLNHTPESHFPVEGRILVTRSAKTLARAEGCWQVPLWFSPLFYAFVLRCQLLNF